MSQPLTSSFGSICSLNVRLGVSGTVSPESFRGLRGEHVERASGDLVPRCADFGRLQIALSTEVCSQCLSTTETATKHLLYGQDFFLL